MKEIFLCSEMYASPGESVSLFFAPCGALNTKPNMRLLHKVAIITGGMKGIGLATAKRFVAEGAKVLIADLDAARLEAAAAEIGHENVSWMQADVTKAADNEALVKKAVETYGGLHIFFANAGVGGTPTLFWELSEEDFDFVMNVNTKAIWLGMKASMPAMMQSGGGSFISTSSLAGVMGSPKASVYSASKHAVVGLMKSAAGEAARFGIRYNSIHPGPIETDMVRDLEKSISRKDPGKGQAFLTGRIPMRRYGTPAEVADLALFLASDDSKYITGCSLRIDGGMSAM